MSSYYRERREAGLFNADEEQREKAEAKLNKDMAKRQDAGVPAVGDLKAEVAALESVDEPSKSK